MEANAHHFVDDVDRPSQAVRLEADALIAGDELLQIQGVIKIRSLNGHGIFRHGV